KAVSAAILLSTPIKDQLGACNDSPDPGCTTIPGTARTRSADHGRRCRGNGQSRCVRLVDRNHCFVLCFQFRETIFWLATTARRREYPSSRQRARAGRGLLTEKSIPFRLSFPKADNTFQIA